MRQVTLAVLLCLIPAGVLAAPSGSLVEAIRNRDAAATRALLTRGGDINGTEADGTTPLHWAAHHGDAATVEALIGAGARVNATNRYGVAPIWLAATSGHADVVDTLLRHGAAPETIRGESGETVLMIAAQGGHVPVLQRLLARGANPNAKDAVRSQTSLMWAAAEGHAGAVRVLVEAGAQVDARSMTGITPLMFAIRAGHIETTLALLDRGATVQATAPDATTMLGLAIINAHWELAARLLDQGADANGLDPRGRPLHLVAFMRRADNRGLSAWLPRKNRSSMGSLDFARALLAKGARINDRIVYATPNYSPTHMALGGAGTTWVGATPLYIAAKNCDVEFVRFLADNGADPEMANAAGVSPLLAAAGIGYTLGESPGTPDEAFETVKLLRGLGNDLSGTAAVPAAMSNAPAGGARVTIRQGWDGAGAMHGAVIRGADQLVLWLIEQGLPLDLKTKAGATALDLARGSSLGITYHVQPELAAKIEKAMRARGLPVPEHRYGIATAPN
ncbi:MAG: ankyrin repeat domain-containing protein [Vicinamibacterales bacterium]|nr:ankyrin repeat domain-containing protein [Vicinamibacterales bacterium]